MCTVDGCRRSVDRTETSQHGIGCAEMQCARPTDSRQKRINYRGPVDIRSRATDLVPCRHCSHSCVTMSARFLDTEVVPADKRMVVVMPGGTVIHRLDAGERHREYRAFHVALLRVEILRQAGTCVVYVINL